VLKYSPEKGYVPASPEFPEIYDAVTPEYRVKAEGRQDGPFEEQDPTGRCYILPLVLAYLYSGRAAAAWEALAQYSPSTADADALRAEIERVLSASQLFVPAAGHGDETTTTLQLPAEEVAETEEFGGERTFAIEVDLDGDGRGETIIGVGARGADKIAEFAAPGDVYVFADVTSASLEAMSVAFSCRSTVPAELLPGFFEASVVDTRDLDGDGLSEILLVWLEQFWWPTAYRSLAVLQFDPLAGAYEMVIDVHRSVSEIGGYATADVDDDGHTEILEINPVYAAAGPGDDPEEWECHFCPHRYVLGVFEFAGTRFVPDPELNRGMPFTTLEKYNPNVGDGVVRAFLPELIALLRDLVLAP
jgi:hypothetical protein